MIERSFRTFRYLFLLIVLCAATAALASSVFAQTLQRDGFDLPAWTLIGIFTLLYFWIALGFWTATFGFIRGLIACDRVLTPNQPLDRPLPQTAVIMPIYNEDVAGVFSRLQAMYEAMAQTDQDAAFDFYVLSDSTDPDIWLEEEQAWASMRAGVQGRSGLYYRRRRFNSGHKSGNIRDFCQHWGGAYRYMVVLDADSLMTPDTFLAMVQKMEEDAAIGILQTVPVPVGRTSYFGRLQQFAAQLYGPIFTSGYTLWSQVAGTYWGHNAVIRVRAFMDCCGLPEFPGKAPLGGEILSHDFVEAALIHKQGWKVVIDHNLAGSYEECPANLIDFAKRDQRWCQGNLQHIRLIVRHGLRGVSKAQLGMGAMSYIFPPRCGRPFWALVLTMNSADRIDDFAGSAKVTLSVILEIVSSVLMAPILMLFHTTFVLLALFGQTEAFRVHAVHTIVGLAGTLLVTWLAPGMLPWLTPVLLPLVFSVPLSLLFASQRVGAWLRKHGLLVIPAEIRPPALLRRQRSLQQTHAALMRKAPHPFIRVVIVPAFNALHGALLPTDPDPVNPERINRLKRVALTGGAAHLTKDERREIISQSDALQWLHRKAWTDWPLDLIERCQRSFV